MQKQPNLPYLNCISPQRYSLSYQPILEFQSYFKVQNYCLSFLFIYYFVLVSKLQKVPWQRKSSRAACQSSQSHDRLWAYQVGCCLGQGAAVHYVCMARGLTTSPFQPPPSTKPSENLNTQCSMFMLEEFYPLCQKIPIRTQCKLPAESRNLFATMIAGWTDFVKLSWIQTVTFVELDFLWNFQKGISEMLVGLYLSRLTHVASICI